MILENDLKIHVFFAAMALAWAVAVAVVEALAVAVALSFVVDSQFKDPAHISRLSGRARPHVLLLNH